MTADIADLHLPIAPDGDVALFTGLLAHLAAAGRIDPDYVAAHTSGLDDALAAAGRPDLAAVAAATGLEPDLLARFYDLFAATEKTTTVYSQGVNQSSSGTDKVNAIINCHLATGRIGQPGMGPFSVTGQPNAMGGREVGGLANMLAAHMALESAGDRERVQRFWNAPVIADKPGLKAVEMFRAVADGRIKALWIMATNPVDSMPDADLVEAAIRACPFVVVSDVIRDTDTVRHGHVRLPALAWGEKDGTVTNSERCISRQRPFLPPPGQARPDWQIIAEVARRMGHAEAFAYSSPAAIFAEHAALSACDNSGSRDFDIGALAGLDEAEFDALAPVQWPQPKGMRRGATRFFADGGFYTPDRKARLVPVVPSPSTRTSEHFPLVLNTGRTRDHWHTMTRTGRSPRLSQHLAEPYAEIHPGDARRLGIRDADLVRVESAAGSVLVRAWLSARQAPGSIFVPMHWNDQFAADARVDRLVPGITDPHSGQPASKNVPIRVERYAVAAYGFAVLAGRPAALNADYWAIARCEGGWRVELGFADAQDWSAFAAGLFGADQHAETLAYHDATGGQHRFACFAAERLLGALYIAAEPVAVSRNWACEQLVSTHRGQRARMAVIVGRPGAGIVDRGATVCSCFGVGVNQIASAIADGCRTIEAVGAATQAGSNCGSCRAEIRSLIEAHSVQAAE